MDTKRDSGRSGLPSPTGEAPRAYSDKFRERNACAIRFMMEPRIGPSIENIKWQCGLRNYTKQKLIPIDRKSVEDEEEV